MIRGPKTLLSEAITAALDEYFIVDADSLYVDLMGDTQISLTNTKLRPQTTELMKSNHQIVKSFTTGVVDQVHFTWNWASLGSEYWVKDASLSISGLKFTTKLSYELEEGFERTQSGRVVASDKSGRRRSSLAEIRQEGLVEAYVRNQVEHIIDAVSLSVGDFELRIELPPNDIGERSIISASGHLIELKSVGGILGGEDRLKHRASFVNGGLSQQLTFGNICVGIFKSKSTGIHEEPYITQDFPLLEPLSYKLFATRYTGERFSGVTSGLKVIGTPVSSSHMNIEEMDVVVHAGLDQIKVLVDLGNIILKKKSKSEKDGDSNEAKIIVNKDGVSLGLLSQEEDKLDTLEEENERGEIEEEVGQECVQVVEGLEWIPTLTEDEWKEVEQDYAEEAKETESKEGETKPNMEEDIYEALKNDVMKSSTFQFPIAGISIILPNEAKLTLEALRINYRADGAIMNFVGEYGAGILVDGYQLVNTNSGSNGSAKSRWVVDLTSSRFTIEQYDGRGEAANSKVARIRWTPAKMDRLIKGWVTMLDAIKDLDLEDNPECEFGCTVNNGFSISFGS